MTVFGVISPLRKQLFMISLHPTLIENEGKIHPSYNQLNSSMLVYYISTKGVIDDIDKVERKIEERIKNKELQDEHIYWLEEKLAPIIEELGRRTGITITERKRQEE